MRVRGGPEASARRDRRSNRAGGVLELEAGATDDVVYFELSEKNASSAVTRLRRSDFMAVTYAFDFVFANFGIAIAARMPMITTTINSSIRVKPLRSFSIVSVPDEMVHGTRGGCHMTKATTGPSMANNRHIVELPSVTLLARSPDW